MNASLINRRLLLAKEFYLRAKENSRKIDAVSKMMAIHNFHIATEITLKAIILSYEIRAEREINIDYESMMSEISSKIKDKKFPYRQQLRSLNSLRGLIQHQGVEPDPSSLEDFEIYTRKFLAEVFKNYFDIDFYHLSRVSLIDDMHTRNLINASLNAQKSDDLFKSLVILDGTFKLLIFSFNNFLPREGFNSSFFATRDLDSPNMSKELKALYTPIRATVEKMYDRIRTSENFTAILSTGIGLSDLKRFQSAPFNLDFSITGVPIVQTTKVLDININDCIWSFEFLVSTVLLWQNQGLKPNIDNELLKTVDCLIDLSTSM